MTFHNKHQVIANVDKMINDLVCCKFYKNVLHIDANLRKHWYIIIVPEMAEES